MTVSERTIKELKKNGWFEGRHIDPHLMLNNLKDKGYSVFPALKQFLQEFGALTFYIVDNNNTPVGFSFILEHAFQQGEIDEVIIKDYPKVIGCENLSLVGAWGAEAVLVISEIGMIYSIDGGLVYEIGIGIEAINNLIESNHSKLKQIDLPDWW